MKYLNQVIHGDCLDILPKLPEKSVDMIFADPPYNLQLSKKQLKVGKRIVKGIKEDWDKFKSFQDYDEFTYAWLSECKQVLKDDGEKAHPTQKPEQLLRRVILASTNEGDVVLDPFCGSGITLKVAKELKRNFIGIEKETTYFNTSKHKLNNILV